MAMASPPIPAEDLDNDGFDWEAAVREIDSACEAAAAVASTSRTDAIAGPRPSHLATGALPQPAKPHGKSRQPTLDRFVDSFQKRRRVDHSHISLGQEYSSVAIVGGDEKPQVDIDLEAATTWIYPINVPLRDYQFSIAKTALFSNTLVALPTGLGKTLIAAVVMYNYFRWFPDGKIIFAAPSRPLVMQQIEACHNIVGIPQEWTIDMTGQMNPLKRSIFWKSKRVFFVTPQVLEKDIQSGICLVKQLVCLVIDEAHRALGNYSYCVAVRELMAVPVQLRILSLTATPGSKQQTIQNVINNLFISTLEYRNESDPDVSPYVHDRKLELVKVAVDKDTDEINNLLLEAIRPFAARLCSTGVLYNRDITMLSPCELLHSRDKFRQAPPLNLPPAKYGEIEGCFAVLITLYHIRKLLSSHGIRPAYEMLEDKLRQGSFARLMARNETIWQAKLLMQQNLFHGAPNPKLVKMTEILIDHFQTKDPKESRVIIFSNFRGSVKDIMNSLSNIGDLVRATEFIGQSSGKTLKGQTQKVQQAVLQKFRTGGYNVIVATSIGEEGLDIMEVDLVICFDANISPLRMIQRMGRTGRKHDGRVVVLASEGSELKGYLKKQASSKAIRKHMHNGGVRSFDFHSSPRMVPHMCKPEVQFVELSIEQFIPRGRKSKYNAAQQSPTFKKMSDQENFLLAKYFRASNIDAWRLSLVAFPYFQAFPSGVHKVRHSSRTTTMLIDAMQRLQGLSDSKTKQVEVLTCSPDCDSFLHDKKEDLAHSRSSVGSNPEAKISDVCVGTLLRENEVHLPDPPKQKLPGHCFLFGEELITVGTSGSVSIASVPVLPLKGSFCSSLIKPESGIQSMDKTVCAYGNSGMSAKPSGLNLHLKGTTEITVLTEAGHVGKEGSLLVQLPRYNPEKDQGTNVQIINSKQVFTNSEQNAADVPHEEDYSLVDIDLSPRLSHYVEEGIVPESPVEFSPFSSKGDSVGCREFDRHRLQSRCPSSMLPKELVELTSSPARMSNNLGMNDPPGRGCIALDTVNSSTGLVAKQMPNADINVSGKVQKTEITSTQRVSCAPLGEEIHSPLANQMANSSSSEWQLNSGEPLKTLVQAPKHKRLRKYAEVARKLPCRKLSNNSDSFVLNNHGSATKNKLELVDHRKGKRRAKKSTNYFIDEEAEVSQNQNASEDEECGEADDGYEDSFIDDKINFTEATQGENSGDMLAFYRRSLLSQSPVEGIHTFLVESVSPRTAESGSSSVKTISNSHQTKQNGLQFNNHSRGVSSATCRLDAKRAVPMTVQSEISGIVSRTSGKLESRKRKLSFLDTGSSLAADLQVHIVHERSRHYEARIDTVSDDDFYQNIDLDAAEEQAGRLLQQRSKSSQLPVIIHSHLVETKADNISGVTSSPPTFDLGI